MKPSPTEKLMKTRSLSRQLINASQFAESRLVVLQLVCYELLVEQVFLSPLHLSFCVIFALTPKHQAESKITHRVNPAVYYRHYR